MKLALADVTLPGLNETAKEASAIVGEANVLVIPTDVTKVEEVVRLRDRVYEAWGEVSARCLAHIPYHAAWPRESPTSSQGQQDSDFRDKHIAGPFTMHVNAHRS